MFSVAQSSLTICNPMDCNVAHWAPLSMEFPRQEYWSGLPFPTLEDIIPHSGIIAVQGMQVQSLVGELRSYKPWNK